MGGLQHARTVRDTGRVRVGEERDGGERIDVVGCRNKTRHGVVSIIARTIIKINSPQTRDAPAVAAASAATPHPLPTSSTDRPRTTSGLSRMYRASPCPPTHGTAQYGGHRPPSVPPGDDDAVSPANVSVRSQSVRTSSPSSSSHMGSSGHSSHGRNVTRSPVTSARVSGESLKASASEASHPSPIGSSDAAEMEGDAAPRAVCVRVDRARDARDTTTGACTRGEDPAAADETTRRAAEAIVRARQLCRRSRNFHTRRRDLNT